MTPDRRAQGRQDVLRVAIVAYHGVLADESDAFRSVLSKIPGARVFTVGDHRGLAAGPGGAQRIDETFADLDRADVVVVPGGLGSHRHPEIALWLRRIHPRWVLASSTGTALLAAAGLLRRRVAATHWLAGPLLERYGAIPSTERLVVDRPFITCAGLTGTYDAAYVVVSDVGGPDLVASIRQQLRDDAASAAQPTLGERSAPCVSRRTRYRSRPTHHLRVAPSAPPPRSRSGKLIEIELEEHPPDPRRRES
jgi:transcriptional regulator GlxA family with amidase domain